MERLPRKDFEYLMKSNMKYDEYTSEQLYIVYLNVLNRDYFISKYESMEFKSFTRRLGDIIHTHNGWMGKDGKGKTATYYRYPVPMCNLSMKQLHDKAIELLENVKGVVTCQR